MEMETHVTSNTPPSKMEKYLNPSTSYVVSLISRIVLGVTIPLLLWLLFWKEFSIITRNDLLFIVDNAPVVFWVALLFFAYVGVVGCLVIAFKVLQLIAKGTKMAIAYHRNKSLTVTNQ